MMHFTQGKHFSEVLFIVAVCYNDEGWILIKKKKKDESHKQAVMMIMMSVVKLMYFNVEC